MAYEIAIALLVGLEAATLYVAVFVWRLNVRLVATIREKQRRAEEVTKPDIKRPR